MSLKSLYFQKCFPNYNFSLSFLTLVLFILQDTLGANIWDPSDCLPTQTSLNGLFTSISSCVLPSQSRSSTCPVLSLWWHLFSVLLPTCLITSNSWIFLPCFFCVLQNWISHFLLSYRTFPDVRLCFKLLFYRGNLVLFAVLIHDNCLSKILSLLWQQFLI